MFDVSANQRDVRLAAVHFAFVGDHAELAEARVDQRLADAVHIAFVRHAVANEFGDGEHLHLVLAAELDQVGHARHAAIVLHDFADDSGGNHSREPRQIDRRFRLPGAHQHSTFAGAKREHVSGTSQIGRLRRGIDRDLNRARAVVRRNASRHASARVDRLAKCGTELRRVLRRHGTDVQVLKSLFGHGQADQSASVLGHEVDGFGRDLFGGERQVAFVLAILVVDNNDHAAGADFLNRIRNVGEWGLGAHDVAILAEGSPSRLRSEPIIEWLRSLREEILKPCNLERTKSPDQ